jgi:hypothetical protein
MLVRWKCLQKWCKNHRLLQRSLGRGRARSPGEDDRVLVRRSANNANISQICRQSAPPARHAHESESPSHQAIVESHMQGIAFDSPRTVAINIVAEKWTTRVSVCRELRVCPASISALRSTRRRIGQCGLSDIAADNSTRVLRVCYATCENGDADQDSAP